jgi:hypothetical protein
MDRSGWIAIGGTAGVLGLIVAGVFAAAANQPSPVVASRVTAPAIATSVTAPKDEARGLRRQSPETLFAKRRAPMYNGPSKASGRFWFSKKATIPDALEKGDAVVVTGRQGDWDEIDEFGKTAWVQDALVGSRGSEEVAGERAARMRQFNTAESDAWPSLYRGFQENGSQLTILVSGRWEGMTPDAREDWLQKALTVYLAMGENRHISEKLEDYSVEVKHDGNWRVLAKWGALLGYSDKLK